MALTHQQYADFVIAEVRKQYGPQDVVIERLAGNRIRVEFLRNGQTMRFRLLIFAVGGAGRSNSLERRVEITSTYQGGLAELAGHMDVVLGIDRDNLHLVGLDSRRLKEGGETHNASTFVYLPSFDKLHISEYFIYRNNRQQLFDAEYQIYMKPSFLVQYLSQQHVLHTSGLCEPPPSHTPEALVDELDGLSSGGSSQTLSYDQQVQLALKKMQIGQLGERLVFQSEVERLLADGKKMLSDKVKWISQTKPFLGYDIGSFDTKSSEEYIEVKSSVGKVTRFYFTSNEMKVAKKYGDSYRLICASYVVAQPKFREFRNPIKAIENGKLKVTSDTSLILVK